MVIFGILGTYFALSTALFSLVAENSKDEYDDSTSAYSKNKLGTKVKDDESTFYRADDVIQGLQIATLVIGIASLGIVFLHGLKINGKPEWRDGKLKFCLTLLIIVYLIASTVSSGFMAVMSGFAEDR